MSHQRIGNFAQRAINRLLISDQHLALLRFGELHAGAQAGVENRQQSALAAMLAIARRASEHAGQRAGFGRPGIR